MDYGVDGLTSATKWEVIGKELRLDDNNAFIKWTLAYATKSSPPTITKIYDWVPPWLGIDFGTNIRYHADLEVTEARHVCRGLNVEKITGLEFKVNLGSASCGGRVARIRQAPEMEVIASKDHYVYFNVRSSSVAYRTVTTGADRPTLGPDCVLLAKMVADGTEITSITDLRNFASVRPRSISTVDFESGGNLCPNPDFETWSFGSGELPDSWELLSTKTWITHAKREEDDQYTGLFAIRTLAANVSLTSTKFRVERDRVYHLGATVWGSSSSLDIYVGVEWYTNADSLISTTYAISANGYHSALTRVDGYVVAPATASYGKVIIKNGTQSGQAIYDAIRMVRAHPSFHATLTGAQSVTNSSTDTVAFNTEVHDWGAQYDHSSNYTFTANFDGIYEFKAQVRADASGAVTDFDDSEIRLVKNASTVVFVGVAANDGNSSSLWQFHLSPGPIKLAKGDTIKVQIHNASGKTFALTNVAAESWFTGRQIQ